MPTTAPEATISSLHITQELEIAAAIEIVWDTLLERLGPASDTPDGKPFPMRIEPWPGGRWYRDLGERTGHLWGHVQVIKAPTLLEICGPLFMSYPAVSHVQYRLAADGGGKGTRLTLTHRAMGLITPEHREGVRMGWGYGLRKIQETAERRGGR